MAVAAGSTVFANPLPGKKPAIVPINLKKVQAPVYTYEDGTRQFATELEAAMNQYLDSMDANWRTNTQTDSAPAVLSGLAANYSGFSSAYRPDAPAHVDPGEDQYIYKGQRLEVYRQPSSGVSMGKTELLASTRMVAMATHLQRSLASLVVQSAPVNNGADTGYNQPLREF